MTTRGILALALSAALSGGAAVAQTRIPSQKLTEGVWASTTPGGANVGWFDLGGTVIAVECGTSDEVARAILEEIQKTTGKKPRYVVLTHAHRDHVGGVGAFVAAGVQVVSSEKAASGILTLFGAPKSGAETPFLMTVSERSLLVGRGPRRAEIDYLGPGHTQGDLVVVVPDAGVLFCGDLAATGVLPFLRADDVDPEGWEKILQRLAGLKVGKLVPGHGAIGPTQGIADTAAYIGQVRQIATKIAMSGVPESVWEAQIADPSNAIQNVPLTPDHVENVKAVARLIVSRRAAPGATKAPTPAARPTAAPTPRSS